eukprot:15717-Heterococcus_DN1.PRE.1
MWSAAQSSHAQQNSHHLTVEAAGSHQSHFQQSTAPAATVGSARASEAELLLSGPMLPSPRPQRPTAVLMPADHVLSSSGQERALSPLWVPSLQQQQGLLAPHAIGSAPATASNSGFAVPQSVPQSGATQPIEQGVPATGDYDHHQQQDDQFSKGLKRPRGPSDSVPPPPNKMNSPELLPTRQQQQHSVEQQQQQVKLELAQQQQAQLQQQELLQQQQQLQLQQHQQQLTQ